MTKKFSNWVVVDGRALQHYLRVSRVMLIVPFHDRVLLSIATPAWLSILLCRCSSLIDLINGILVLADINVIGVLRHRRQPRSGPRSCEICCEYFSCSTRDLTYLLLKLLKSLRYSPDIAPFKAINAHLWSLPPKSRSKGPKVTLSRSAS